MGRQKGVLVQRHRRAQWLTGLYGVSCAPVLFSRDRDSADPLISVERVIVCMEQPSMVQVVSTPDHGEDTK